MANKKQIIEQFYQEHSDTVYRYAVVVTGSSCIAEEVTQDTFLFAYQNLHKYDAARSVSALGWLFGILRNKVRSAMITEHHVGSSERGADLSTPGTGDLFEVTSEARRAYQCISELKIEQREVIVLCGLLEVDYVTAARILEVPVGTIRSRLFRARKKLYKSTNRSEQLLLKEYAL